MSRLGLEILTMATEFKVLKSFEFVGADVCAYAATTLQLLC